MRMFSGLKDCITQGPGVDQPRIQYQRKKWHKFALKNQLNYCFCVYLKRVFGEVKDKIFKALFKARFIVVHLLVLSIVA